MNNISHKIDFSNNALSRIFNLDDSLKIAEIREAVGYSTTIRIEPMIFHTTPSYIVKANQLYITFDSNVENDSHITISNVVADINSADDLNRPVWHNVENEWVVRLDKLTEALKYFYAEYADGRIKYKAQPELEQYLIGSRIGNFDPVINYDNTLQSIVDIVKDYYKINIGAGDNHRFNNVAIGEETILFDYYDSDNNTEPTGKLMVSLKDGVDHIRVELLVKDEILNISKIKLFEYVKNPNWLVDAIDQLIDSRSKTL